MKKILIAVATVGALASCSTTKPAVVAERTTVVENIVEVKQKCIERLPPAPDLVDVPRTGAADQALARIRREEALTLYINQLIIVAKPCVKDSK